MPDVLAIHWDKKRLRVVEASIGASVRIVQSFAVEVPELPKSTWLRDALRRQGTTARQVIVCLPRDEAILRQLELPDAPDDELPSLVYFQAREFRQSSARKPGIPKGAGFVLFYVVGESQPELWI